MLYLLPCRGQADHGYPDEQMCLKKECVLDSKLSIVCGQHTKIQHSTYVVI